MMLRKDSLNRLGSILLLFVTLFFVLTSGTLVVNASDVSSWGSGDALSKTAGMYSDGLNCVCPKKYSKINRTADTTNGYGVRGDADTLELQSSTKDKCTYSGGVEVSCGEASADKLLKRYLESDSDFFKGTGTDPTSFVNNASQYAYYIQAGLTTKTQGGAAQGYRYEDLGDGMLKKAMFDFNNNAHVVYSFLIGFAFVTSMLVFILIFMKITWLPDHPIKRREAMEDILTSGISVILTGGIWIVISLFQSIFDRFWSSYAVYSKDWKTVANMFLYEYKGLVIGILGIAALTALLMLVKNFIALSFSGDNPNARKQKMTSVLFCGIATAGLGGLAVFMGFFWNALNF